MARTRFIIFWVVVIAALLVVEFAELTRLFTIPFQVAIGNPVAFVFALAFTTVLALVGAIFVGIYISQRLQAPGGFTPFEEEMLKMRSEVKEIRADLDRSKGAAMPNPDPPDPKAPGPR